MPQRNMNKALRDYQEALARRLERLGTRHSYFQAQDAADELEKLLRDRGVTGLTGVGIGLNGDRSDVCLIVNVLAEKVGSKVPNTFKGIDVTTNVSGEVSAL